jgi:hypothetical protein
MLARDDAGLIIAGLFDHVERVHPHATSPEIDPRHPVTPPVENPGDEVPSATALARTSEFVYAGFAMSPAPGPPRRRDCAPPRAAHPVSAMPRFAAFPMANNLSAVYADRLRAPMARPTSAAGSMGVNGYPIQNPRAPERGRLASNRRVGGRRIRNSIVFSFALSGHRARRLGAGFHDAWVLHSRADYLVKLGPRARAAAGGGSHWVGSGCQPPASRRSAIDGSRRSTSRATSTGSRAITRYSDRQAASRRRPVPRIPHYMGVAPFTASGLPGRPRGGVFRGEAILLKTSASPAFLGPSSDPAIGGAFPFRRETSTAGSYELALDGGQTLYRRRVSSRVPGRVASSRASRASTRATPRSTHPG